MSRTLAVRLDGNIKEKANKKNSFDPPKKRPNAKLLRAIADADAGNNLSPKFETAKDAVASMMADD